MYFEAQIVSRIWSVQTSSGWLLCPFEMSPWFTEYVFTLNKISFSKLVLYFPFPSSGISHFFMESWFLLVRNRFRSWELGTRCAHCCWGVVLKPPQWTELGFLRVCVCVYVHTHCSHIYAVFTYTYYLKTEFTLISSILIHTRVF